MSIITFLGIAFFWFVIMGCITGAIAQKKGHEFLPWFLFGGFLVILALPMALLLSEQSGGRNSPFKICPYCGSKINSGAGKCPKCNRSQPASATSSMQSWEQTIAKVNELKE